MYPIYRAVTGFGDYKIASNLVHQPGFRGHAKAFDQRQEKEAQNVGKALSRWAANEQEHLYKNAKKRTFLLKRLEVAMMFVDDVKRLLERQADSAEKRETARALSFFFYGRQQREADNSSIRVLRNSLIGLHQVVQPAYDDGSLGLGFMGFRPGGWYLYFHGSDQERHLWVHTFMLSIDGISDEDGHRKTQRFWSDKPDYSSDEVQGFRFRHSGYAFPLPNGEIHCMTADQGPPGRRYYTVWGGPLRGTEQYLDKASDGDRMFHYWEAPLTPGTPPGLYLSATGRGIWPSGVRGLRKPDRMTQRRIEVLIGRAQWSTIE